MLRPLKIAYEYFALYSSLTLLGLICLTWSVFALPLYFILPRRLGTAVGRRGIMSGFRIYAWSLAITGTYRLDLRAIDSLKGGPAVILAPNHPNLIDALLILDPPPEPRLRHEIRPRCEMCFSVPVPGWPATSEMTPRARWPRVRVASQGGRRAAAFSGGHLHTVRDPTDQFIGRQRGSDRQTCQGPRADLDHRNRLALLEQRVAAFKRPTLPIVYRVRLGKRFEPPSDVPAFTDELDHYYRQELAGALQSRWLKQT